ncbi:MAG: hypothetical protein AAF415_02615 [Pseudomonadota bacterium]
MRADLERFLSDEKGSITVEFVIWLPFLLFWFVLTVAAFAAWDSRLDATRATYTIADLITVMPTIDENDVESLFRLYNQLLPNPPEGEPNQMRISSLERTDTGEFSVIWSRATTGGELMPFADDQILGPDDLKDSVLEAALFEFNQSAGAILVESYVVYEPIININGADLRWVNQQVAEHRLGLPFKFGAAPGDE